MSWGRLDDGFYDHPKVIRLRAKGQAGRAAIGLWTLANAYCGRHVDDGTLTREACKALGGTTREARMLVESGLWTECDDGYRFHDWSKYRKDSKALESRRRSDRERQSRYRSRDSNVTESRDSNVVPPARVIPARPDPVISLSNESSSESGPSDTDVQRSTVEASLFEREGVQEAPESKTGSPGSPDRKRATQRQPDRSTEVRRVFDYWVAKTWSGRGREPGLDKKRRARITARLKEGFLADDLCRAIDGALTDEWLTEKGYLGVETVLRDAATVERHMGAINPRRGVAGRGRMSAAELARRQREWEQENGGKGMVPQFPSGSQASGPKTKSMDTHDGRISILEFMNGKSSLDALKGGSRGS